VVLPDTPAASAAAAKLARPGSQLISAGGSGRSCRTNNSPMRKIRTNPAAARFEGKRARSLQQAAAMTAIDTRLIASLTVGVGKDVPPASRMPASMRATAPAQACSRVLPFSNSSSPNSTCFDRTQPTAPFRTAPI